MRTHVVRSAVAVAAAAAAISAFTLTPAFASQASRTETDARRGADHALFVQTDSLAGNSVIAYHRADSGALTWVGTYATGGLGGVAVKAPLDSLASQGSLTLDPEHGLLFAVNAGSDTLTEFAVHGASLERLQIIGTDGAFPVSVSVHENLVAVVNAGNAGSVTVFRLAGNHLVRVHGGHESLGLSNTNPPLFITAPAQVGFDQSGRHLIVTTKANNSILVFGVRANGSLTDAVSNPSAGPVPFSFVIDAYGHLVVTEAAHSTVTTYSIAANGTLTPLTTSVGDGGVALCWNANAGGFVFGANAGAGTIASYKTNSSGGLVLSQAIAANTASGPIDLASAEHGHLLYVQDAVAGEVQGFAVNADGTLTLVTTVTGLPAFLGAGMEGLAAA